MSKRGIRKQDHSLIKTSKDTRPSLSLMAQKQSITSLEQLRGHDFSRSAPASTRHSHATGNDKATPGSTQHMRAQSFPRRGRCGDAHHLETRRMWLWHLLRPPNQKSDNSYQHTCFCREPFSVESRRWSCGDGQDKIARMWWCQGGARQGCLSRLLGWRRC
jgi:hypothetical protein